MEGGVCGLGDVVRRGVISEWRLGRGSRQVRAGREEVCIDIADIARRARICAELGNEEDGRGRDVLVGVLV